MIINKNILIILILYIIFTSFNSGKNNEYFYTTEKFSDGQLIDTREIDEEIEEEEEEIEEDCGISDEILADVPKNFSINNCKDCMQNKLCKKYQRKLCTFTNSLDATKYLINKCKNYCTENTERRYGDVTKFNENIGKIGILKDALCKKFK